MGLGLKKLPMPWLSLGGHSGRLATPRHPTVWVAERNPIQSDEARLGLSPPGQRRAVWGSTDFRGSSLGRWSGQSPSHELSL